MLEFLAFWWDPSQILVVNIWFIDWSHLVRKHVPLWQRDLSLNLPSLPSQAEKSGNETWGSYFILKWLYHLTVPLSGLNILFRWKCLTFHYQHHQHQYKTFHHHHQQQQHHSNWFWKTSCLLRIQEVLWYWNNFLSNLIRWSALCDFTFVWFLFLSSNLLS